MLDAVLQRLKRSEFAVALSTTSVATAVQMLCGLVVAKIIAIKVGPSGVALLGQFTDFKNLLTTAGTGAFGSGMTKLVADPDYDESEVVSTCTVFSVLMCALVGTAVFICSDQLSLRLFGIVEFGYVLSLFSLFLVFFAINNVLLALINGRRAFKLLFQVKLLTSFIALFSSGGLCWYLGLKGAFVATVINLPVAFLLALLMIRFQGTGFVQVRLSAFKPRVLYALLGFTLMGVTSLALNPLVDLFLRNFIIENASYDEAGMWSAMTRLGGYYGGMISAALGAYYLPKLSSLTSDREIRVEIYKGVRLIMPLFVLIAVALWLVREWVILLLFSADFLGMQGFFLPFLVGDFFKFLSFMVAYLLWAKAMTGIFICLQITMAITRISFSVIFFERLGVVGILWASAANYLLYGLLVTYVFRKLLFGNR